MPESRLQAMDAEDNAIKKNPKMKKSPTYITTMEKVEAGLKASIGIFGQEWTVRLTLNLGLMLATLPPSPSHLPFAICRPTHAVCHSLLGHHVIAR